MAGNLLNNAREYFKSREQRILQYLEDDGGKYAFVSTVQGVDGYKSTVIVAARTRFFTRDGKAWTSFMVKLLERAADANARVVLFTLQATTRQWLIFDPEAILKHGEQPGDESARKKKGEDWLDIPADWGVELRDFAERRATPRKAPADDDPITTKTEAQGLDRFATDGGVPSRLAKAQDILGDATTHDAPDDYRMERVQEAIQELGTWVNHHGGEVPNPYGWDWLFRTERAHRAYGHAIGTWGEEAQVDMMGEEAAELSRAVHRYQNGRDGLEDLAHELVDARQLMEQLSVDLIPRSMLRDETDRALATVEDRLDLGWDDGPGTVDSDG